MKLLRTLEGHERAIHTVAFDPEGQTLASGSRDSTVKLWEVASGKLLRNLQEHEHTVWSIAFDPAGRTLASGSGDTTVRLWEVSRSRTFMRRWWCCSVTRKPSLAPNQWRSQARYEMGDGLICGFRQDGDRDSDLDLVLHFGTNVGRPVQTLFQGLFESFLARRNLNVFRYEPVICSNGHPLNRAVVREELRSGAHSAFCPKCGENGATESRPADPIDAE